MSGGERKKKKKKQHILAALCQGAKAKCKY